MRCRAINGVFHRDSTEVSATKRNYSPTSDDNEDPDPSLDAVLIQKSMSREYPESGFEQDGMENEDNLLSSAFIPSPFLRGNVLSFGCTIEKVGCLEVLCKFQNFKPSSRGSVIIRMRISSNATRKTNTD